MNMYWSETGSHAELELVRAAVEGGAGEGVWVTKDACGPRAYERLA